MSAQQSKHIAVPRLENPPHVGIDQQPLQRCAAHGRIGHTVGVQRTPLTHCHLMFMTKGRTGMNHGIPSARGFADYHHAKILPIPLRGIRRFVAISLAALSIKPMAIRLDSESLKTNEDKTMRFMILVKASPDSEAGVMPSEELMTAMGNFNEELAKAGILIECDGLQPSSKGARVRFSGDQRTVIDGPFAETKELIAGYWLWQVKSKEEAIEWVKRCPNPMPGTEAEIEIRQVFEAEDFGAEFTPQLRDCLLYTSPSPRDS